MTETPEEFLARGGKVTTIPEGEMAFQRLSDHKRHVERKKMEGAFTDHEMRNAENETFKEEH
tara:strand:- start:60 stop:245 length:186 start_codon:yes stop_codon:yes gene_type:complete